MSPRPSVTGTISASTLRTPGTRTRTESGKPEAAQPGQEEQDLDDRPQDDPAGVDLDAVVLGDLRRQADQAPDDHRVSEHRSEGRGPEPAAGLQDPLDRRRQAEQRHGRDMICASSTAMSANSSESPGARGGTIQGARTTASALTAPRPAIARPRRAPRAARRRGGVPAPGTR